MLFGANGSFAIMPASFDGKEVGYFATIEAEDRGREGWAKLEGDKRRTEEDAGRSILGREGLLAATGKGTVSEDSSFYTHKLAFLLRPTSRHVVIIEETSGRYRRLGPRYSANRRPRRRDGVRGRRDSCLRAFPSLRTGLPDRGTADYIRKVAEASLRAHRPGDGLYEQEWQSTEVEPALLRAGGQGVDCVGSFQIQRRGGRSGMDVYVQR